MKRNDLLLLSKVVRSWSSHPVTHFLLRKATDTEVHDDSSIVFINETDQNGSIKVEKVEVYKLLKAFRFEIGFFLKKLVHLLHAAEYFICYVYEVDYIK